MSLPDGERPDPEFEAFLEFLRDSRGFDFTGYKRGTLTRRVDRRMQELGLESYAAYRDHLEVDPDEWTFLFNTILINVTKFFRDPDAWEYLASDVVPSVIEARAPDKDIRIWSAGCASGEETFSLAMVFADALGSEDFTRRVKIYGTDVDEEALDQGRAATYRADQIEAVPEPYRSRYFKRADDGSVFRTELRRAVIFGRHDITRDAPISRLDLLLCRNTLMYLNAETQAAVLDRFHYALRDTGYLFLGRAEMLVTHGGLFSPVHPQHRIFSKVLGSTVPRAPLARRKRDSGDRAGLLGEGFEHSPVAQIIVDSDDAVVGANRQAQAALKVGTRDLGLPLRNLELSYRPAELRALIDQARAERRPVAVSAVEHRLPDGRVRFYDVSVVPLEGAGNEVHGVCVSFVDVSEIRRLQSELASSKEDLETTNEELQSTNEELETTNEELQSSNEELETMNEELHSTNEQLEAVNTALQQRSRDLDRTNVFMEAILSSLSAAVVVVDPDTLVEVWNDAAEDLWGLAPERVEGRSFFALDIGLPVERLRDPLRRCIEENSEFEEVMLRATDRRGQSLQCRVTCTPLGSSDGERHGVVLSMEPGEATGSG